MFNAYTIFASTLVAASAGFFAFFGRPYYWRGIEFMEKDFRAKLRRLHVSTRNLRRYLILWSIALVAIFFGVWIGLGLLVIAVFAVAFFLCVPWYYVRRLAEKHRLRVEDQLADAMVSLSSAIKAGLSLAQSLEVLADQSPRPLNAEFRRIVGEYRMGKPLDRTLEEAKERLQSENFALFSAALLASRESGGRLNETVDRIAHSVRELQRLERKIESETAMARKSAVYMAMAPFFILAIYFFVDAGSVGLLFTTVPGQLVLVAAVMLNIIAYLWARHILNPDI
ncbi:MAG: type II secretion system F family protein [Pirellulales bacterium]